MTTDQPVHSRSFRGRSNEWLPTYSVVCSTYQTWTWSSGRSFPCVATGMGWSEDVLKVRLAQLLSWKIVSIRLQKQIKKIKSPKKTVLAPDWPSLSTEKHNPVGWDALAYLYHRSCCLFPFVPKLTNSAKTKKKKGFLFTKYSSERKKLLHCASVSLLRLLPAWSEWIWE